MSLTWAAHDGDEMFLSLGEMTSTFLRLKSKVESHNQALKGVKISRDTLLCFSQVPASAPYPERFYGVPVEIDDSLALFECVPIYPDPA